MTTRVRRLKASLPMLIRSVVLLALLAGTIEAQAKVALDTRHLRLTTDSLDVYLVRQGRQQRTGTIVDRLDTVRVDGEVRLQRIYRRTDAVLGNGVDTLVDAFADLTPRWVDSRSDGGGVEHVVWRSGRITGVVQQGGKPARQLDTIVTSGVYSRASFDLILRASPLAEGYEVVVAAYSGRQGLKTLSAKVTAAEVLPRLGAAWRVDADFAGLSVTLWIAKDSRRLLREVIRAAPGTEILFVATRDSPTKRSFE